MTSDTTGLSRRTPEGVCVQGGGIEIPFLYHYITVKRTSLEKKGMKKEHDKDKRG